jgi:hypothetical protein
MKNLLLSAIVGLTQPTTVQPSQPVIQQSVVRTTVTTTTVVRYPRRHRRGGCTNGTCR